MSKSAIYAVNTEVGSAVPTGVIFPIEDIVRRFGNNVNLVNSGIVLKGSGYYSVSVNLTLTATAADEMTATLFQDGMPVPGATASVTMAAVGDVATLSIDALVRVLGYCDTSVLTVRLSSQPVTNVSSSIEVEKK